MKILIILQQIIIKSRFKSKKIDIFAVFYTFYIKNLNLTLGLRQKNPKIFIFSQNHFRFGLLLNLVDDELFENPKTKSSALTIFECGFERSFQVRPSMLKLPIVGGAMSIIILFICLILQRMLAFNYGSYQINWLQAYFRWVIAKVEYVTQGHSIIGIIILLMPVLIVFNLFFTLIYHLGGVYVYAIFNFILVWLCIDGRDLIKTFADLPPMELFVLSYERVFAVIFWFVVFGPAGLILYTSVISLRNCLQAEGHQSLLFYVLKLKAILDWAPVRLLGLSYAVVGHYSSVSKVWAVHWQGGLQSDAELTIEFGSAALGVNKSALNAMQPEVVQIIDRALIFWLITISLLTLAFWLG